MRRFPIVVCVLMSAVVSGCAAGGMMASLSDDELPVDAPPSPYPTAIEPALLKEAAAQERDLKQAKRAANAEIPTAARPIAVPLASVPAPLPLKQPAPMPIEMPHQVARPTAAAATPTPAGPEPGKPPESAAIGSELPPVVTAVQVRAATAAPLVLAQPMVPAQESTATVASSTAQPILINFPAEATPPTAAAFQSADDRLAAIAQQRDVLIAMLEEDIHHRQAAASAATDLALPRLEQQLRLLYAAAGRPDDAARTVESLTEPEREAYKHLMFGLSTWFADQQPQRVPLRAARVLRSLRDAQSELAVASKLALANLAFCERVESFGWYTEFARREFFPKQQVILYVEVENFAAQEKSPHSFETELQGSYQIFDSRGNIVAERKLPLDREVCRNIRHDYFLAYPIYIPESIGPGRYRLELTIEDLKASGQYQGRKFGEGTIEFTVRS